MNWNIEHVGMVEWFVDAVIGYVSIHSNFKPKEEWLDIEIKDISFNSKDKASELQLSKINYSLKASYLNYSKTFFNNLFDINKVTYLNLPKNIDIFTYSFPCQDLSVQGLQKGINKQLKTRSGLLWEIERILTECKNHFKQDELPKYLLMENVKNLTSKRHIGDYTLWVNKLNELGYETKTYILNSKDFGSAQNRERVFGLSVRKDYKNKVDFCFPNFNKFKIKPKLLKDILDLKNTSKEIDLSKYKTTNFSKTKSDVIKKTILGYTNFNSENYVYDINGVGPTLTASGANSRIKIELPNKAIRYMEPNECFRYMGFDDFDFLKIKQTDLIKNTRLTFLAGNSISIEVLENIFKNLKFGDSNE